MREIAVNLSNASSKVKKSTVFLDQQYRIPFYFIEKWRHRKDTVGLSPLQDSDIPAEPVVATGDADEDIPPQEDAPAEGGEAPPADTLAFDDSQITTAFIGHSSEYSVYRRIYQDNLSSQVEKAFYDGVFNYHPSATYDSLRVMKLENKVFLRLQPWSAEAIVSKLDVGLGHKLMQYYSFDKTFTQTPSNHSWNATYLYAGVEGQFKRYFEWNARGKYVFLGDEINDFDLSGEARLNLYPFRRHRTSPLSVFARFNTSLDEPEYYLQHLYTNHFCWDNQFTKISTTTLEGGFAIPLWQVGARVAYNLLAGNIWYGTNGYVNQNPDPMSVLSVSAYKNFTFGNLIHLDHRVLFQLSSRQDIVPLPLVAANVRYYIQFPVGPVKAMTMQVGANVWYNTAWYLPSWNPALGVFHNQEELLYGNAPVADAFINMQWKRACIFVKMENANMGWPLDYKDYFSADRYIRTTRAVKFGIYWPFYTQPGKDSHNHGSGSSSSRPDDM